MSDEQANLEDTQIATAGLAYYLYRLAGCPFGNTLSGYQAWMEVNVFEPFHDLCEQADTSQVKDDSV